MDVRFLEDLGDLLKIDQDERALAGPGLWSFAPCIARCCASHLTGARRLSSPSQGASPATPSASSRPSGAYGHPLLPSPCTLS